MVQAAGCELVSADLHELFAVVDSGNRVKEKHAIRSGSKKSVVALRCFSFATRSFG